MKRFFLVLAACGAAITSAAGEDRPAESERRPQRVVVTKQGDPSKVAICPVCGKPYHMHVIEGFECIPRFGPGETLVRVHYAEATCPVCGLEFKGPMPGGWGKRAQYDRDFCVHAPGTEVVFCSCWLCARCGYAAPWVDFNRKVDKKVKGIVRTKISQRTFDFIVKRKIGIPGLKLTPDTVAEIVEMRHLPEIMIYDNAVEIEKSRRSVPQTMAKLYLEASHACRRAICSGLGLTSVNLTKPLRGLDGFLARSGGASMPPEEVARVILIELDRRQRAVASGDLREELTPETKYCMYLKLAGVCDRMGDSAPARTYIDKAITVLAEPKQGKRPAYEEMKEVATARRRLLEKEETYQDAAIDQMIKALGSGVYEGQALLQTIYLVGELSRRTGDYPRAVAWLRAADRLCAGDPKRSAWIRKGLDSRQLKSIHPGRADAELITRLIRSAGKIEAARPEPQPPATAEGPETRPATPAPAAPDLPAPKSCAEAMGRIFQALEKFHEAKGGYPDALEELVTAGFITRKAAGDFHCVGTGAKLFYSKPKEPGDDRIILFHKNPRTCECKNVLKGTGKVIQIGQ